MLANDRIYTQLLIMIIKVARVKQVSTLEIRHLETDESRLHDWR
jgi:hypothetical protein